MAEHQHNYRFGSPSKGWPDFDETGRIITDQDDAQAFVEMQLFPVEEGK